MLGRQLTNGRASLEARLDDECDVIFNIFHIFILESDVISDLFLCSLELEGSSSLMDQKTLDLFLINQTQDGTARSKEQQRACKYQNQIKAVCSRKAF